MLGIAEVEGDKLVRFPVDVRELYPDTSFPDQWAGEFKGKTYVKVEPRDPPVYDPDAFRLESADPELVDGRWVEGWQLIELTTEQMDFRLAKKRSGMVCSPFQARAALLAGGMLDAVEKKMAEPDTDALVKLAWNHVVMFKRTSPAVTSLCKTLGMTDEQMDALFEAAMGIEV